MFVHGLNLTPELIHILKTSIDGGKAHVSYVIEFAKLVHYQFPHCPGANFTLAGFPKPVFDSVEGRVDSLEINRPFLQRSKEPTSQFFFVEWLPGTVVLDHPGKHQLSRFKGGISFPTTLALTTTTNLVSVSHQTGVNNLRFTI